MKLQPVIIGFVIAVPLCVLSYLLLDQRIATLVQEFILSHGALRKVASNIPDFLLLIVLAITAYSWSSYFFLLSKGMRSRHARFAQLCGVSIPLSYLAKSLLQSAFGRVNPKVWLTHHELSGIHLFPAQSMSYGFPSGHMTVFTTLAVVLCYIYPSHKRLYLAALAVLGVALVVTNYHFLSDVIFGAYLGLLISYLSDFGLMTMSSSYRQAYHDADVTTAP